jgi:hypothetical protein
MEADRNYDTVILQPFGVVARGTPTQAKAWIDRQIQLESKKESPNSTVGAYSVEGWGKFWAQTIQGYRDPRQIGGAEPHAEEYLRYIVSQRRKLHLPELASVESK